MDEFVWVRVKKGRRIFFGEGQAARLRKEYEEFTVPSEMIADRSEKAARVSALEIIDGPGGGAAEAPADEEDAMARHGDKGVAIIQALSKLNPDEEGDWTDAGDPRVERVSAIAGFKVTRSQIRAVAPGVKRDNV